GVHRSEEERHPFAARVAAELVDRHGPGSIPGLLHEVLAVPSHGLHIRNACSILSARFDSLPYQPLRDAKNRLNYRSSPVTFTEGTRETDAVLGPQPAARGCRHTRARLLRPLFVLEHGR